MDISRQQLVDLVAKVDEAAPGLEETGAKIDELITAVIDNAGAANMELEGAVQKGFGANEAVAWMAQAAMAAIIDSFPADNVRAKLTRAGRAIGRFMVDRYQEKLREQLGLPAEGN